MAILILMNFLILCLIIKVVKNDITIKRILKVYLVFNFIILFTSQLNLFELYKVSDKVYYLWLTNINVFFIVFELLTRKCKIEVNNVTVLKKIEDSKFLWYLQLILTIILLYYSYRFNILIKSNINASEIRMLTFTKLFSSNTESILYNYIVISIYKILTIITAILLANKKFKNKICILGIIDIIINMTIGYGRMSIYEFGLFFLIAYFIKNGNTKIKLSLKKIGLGIMMGLLLFLLAMIATAIRRGISILNIKQMYNVIIKEQLIQVVTYFTGGFRALDLYIENGFYTIDSFTIGRATFAGIEEIISNFLILMGKDYISFNSLVGNITQQEIIIGTNITFNAFYTCIMNFYSDFGYLGVIIGPVIHAILLGACTINFAKKKNLASQVLIIFTMMNAFSSIYRWNYQFGQTTFTLLIIILWNILEKITVRE